MDQTDQPQEGQTPAQPQAAAPQQDAQAAPAQSAAEGMKSKIDTVYNKVYQAENTEQEVKNIINVGKGLFGL